MVKLGTMTDITSANSVVQNVVGVKDIKVRKKPPRTEAQKIARRLYDQQKKIQAAKPKTIEAEAAKADDLLAKVKQAIDNPQHHFNNGRGDFTGNCLDCQKTYRGTEQHVIGKKVEVVKGAFAGVERVRNGPRASRELTPEQ